MKFVGVNALLLGDAPAGMKRVFNRLLIKSGFDTKLFYSEEPCIDQECYIQACGCKKNKTDEI